MLQKSEPRWQFDHLSLDAVSGDHRVAALACLLGLTPGDRPSFPFPGQWLYRDGEALLHVIETSPETTPQPVINHMAFRSEAGLAGVVAEMAASGLAHRVVRIPERALAQIFVGVSPGCLTDDAVIPGYRPASDAPTQEIRQ